jgi:hypothetical protein
VSFVRVIIAISIYHRSPDRINIQRKSATNIVFNLGPLIFLLLFTVKLFGLKIKIKIISEASLSMASLIHAISFASLHKGC